MKIIADTNIPFVKECFSSLGRIKLVASREITPMAVRDADTLLVRTITKADEKLLAGSKVKFVGTATIGFEHIDIDYLKRKGIGFASAPGSNANSVAEYVIAALLEIAAKYDIELEGKTIGIIGVGNVGSLVQAKCRALGMGPVLNDPPLERQTHDKKYRPLEELYDCDFVTLHTPLTYDGQDKTFHFADDKFFQSVKDGVIFINTSRGGVVDGSSLKKAIKTEKLKATVLDVWENEPDIDTELLEMADICTAHIAGYSLDGRVAGVIMIYHAWCKHFGLQPQYNIEDFLPEAQRPELKLAVGDLSQQQILRQAVTAVYDITADDKRLRQVLNMPLGKRCATFDKLRNGYPIRREFQNTNILLAAAGAEDLTKKLKGIGFKINTKK